MLLQSVVHSTNTLCIQSQRFYFYTRYVRVCVCASQEAPAGGQQHRGAQDHLLPLLKLSTAPVEGALQTI